MRLLNVEKLANDQELEFKEFEFQIPLYAIASHKWGERKTEITYKEVLEKQGTTIEKAGYHKVLGFAKYIQKHIRHVEWMWIDTCCINQDSESEVSEAVRCSLKWYRNAEICLAYLADVQDPDDEDSFQRSVWFRRGWTLQELLAPRTVVFLSNEWRVIGHKGTGRCKGGVAISSGRPLLGPILSTTKLPESVLIDFGRHVDFTADQKLEWISGRETLKPEDMSYCLFGLFNIHISIMYGEEGDSARKRLLYEIDRRRPPIAARVNGAEPQRTSCVLAAASILGAVVSWAPNVSKTLSYRMHSSKTNEHPDSLTSALDVRKNRETDYQNDRAEKALHDDSSWERAFTAAFAGGGQGIHTTSGRPVKASIRLSRL